MKDIAAVPPMRKEREASLRGSSPDFSRSDAPRSALHWLTVVVFATAMAWVEAAVVFYLRTLVDRIDPYQPNPLPLSGGLAQAELVREAATLVMIFTVGLLAGRNWHTRFGYMAVVFGMWDIFYYAFLKIMCGWPNSLLDWDVLFLLPLPWWGPVLAPMLIAALMVLWGTLASQLEQKPSRRLSNLRVWTLSFIGMALALYLFMADALRVLPQGEAALRNLLPRAFNWPLFGVALLLMAAPVIKVCLALRQEKRSAVSNSTEGNVCDQMPQA